MRTVSIVRLFSVSILPNDLDPANAGAVRLNAPQRNEERAVGQRSDARLAEGEVLPAGVLAGRAALRPCPGSPDDLVGLDAEVRVGRADDCQPYPRLAVATLVIDEQRPAIWQSSKGSRLSQDSRR